LLCLEGGTYLLHRNGDQLEGCERPYSTWSRGSATWPLRSRRPERTSRFVHPTDELLVEQSCQPLPVNLIEPSEQVVDGAHLSRRLLGVLAHPVGCVRRDDLLNVTMPHAFDHSTPGNLSLTAKARVDQCVDDAAIRGAIVGGRHERIRPDRERRWGRADRQICRSSPTPQPPNEIKRTVDAENPDDEYRNKASRCERRCHCSIHERMMPDRRNTRRRTDRQFWRDLRLPFAPWRSSWLS
jgi:hypothetical protein